ncbi:MAG: LCP family protein [Ktedonobacteraceae bacterium]
MSNTPYYPADEPTQPTKWSDLPGPERNDQGKLVIGSFQDTPKNPSRERKPYQYPQQQYPQYPQQPPAYPQQPQRQQYPQQPDTPPRDPAYPYQQPGGGKLSGSNRSSRPRRRRGCTIGCLTVILLLCIIGGFGFFTAQRVMAFGSAISTQSPLSTQTGYMSTSDRVNVLVMGYGGGNHQGANLTDSMIVMSVMPQSQHTTLISVPRDLWVQVPAGSGHYQKINSVYSVSSNNGSDPAAGGNAAAQKISLITGLDVKYWMTINFEGFRDLINSIGGIDVYVPNSFTARYPKNDDPSIDASWIKVHFSKGTQHMDGETAIRYARAREVLDNPAEGTDFARSARQQVIIKAALSKVKQVSTWPHLFNAMDALRHTIYTNMSLADLGEFALKMDLTNAHRVGLSNQNVLVDGQSSDGQYILKPVSNNWQAIIDYIKQKLYN